MAAVAALTRSAALAAGARSPFARFLSRRYFLGSSSPSAAGLRLSRSAISHPSVRTLFPGAARMTAIRCRVQRSGHSPYSPLNSGTGSFSDRPPTEMAPLFHGCDYEHWLVVMDKPSDENATKSDMIDFYVKTLARVLGSEEEAKKKIYNVSCEPYFGYFGFGCEIDEETSFNLEGLPGVLFVLPDAYLDAENKDYGAELFVDGQIVERSPERQRRVYPRELKTGRGTMTEPEAQGEPTQEFSSGHK